MNIYFKTVLLLFWVACFGPSLSVFAQDLKNIRVLVYTKNGKGYVHDNIAAATRCIQQLGTENKFIVDVADNATVFTTANLKKYTMLIFTSTNNDVFDNDEQRLAFRKYIEAGGGFVGIHSVTGTERNWTWFKQMVGGTFAWHAKNQKFSVQVIDSGHPSMQGLPKVWERSLGDECYFTKEMYPGIKVLMAHQLNTLNRNDADSTKIRQNSVTFNELYPAVWCQNFDGGNIWVTTLGHNKEYYREPMFVKHLLLGIKFIAGLTHKLDFTKAYATSRDTPVRY